MVHGTAGAPPARAELQGQRRAQGDVLEVYGGRFCSACGGKKYIYIYRYYVGVDRQCAYIYIEIGIDYPNNGESDGRSWKIK